MEVVEEVEVVPEVVVWTTWVSPSVSGEVAVQDEVMYCQKALLVHSP